MKRITNEYKKELLKIDKGKFKKFSNIEELRREIETQKKKPS